MNCVEPSLTIAGIPITDWIQAFGAAIGIIAAIIGFFKLFKKNADLQNQINSLKVISEQSENQSRSLAEQVEQMQESNRIQNQLYEIFKINLISSLETKVEEKQETELKKKQEKLINKPKLEWNGSMYLMDKVVLTLRNNGEIARIVGFKELTKNSVNHNLNSFINVPIEKKEDIKITFTAKPFGLSPRECFVELELTIQDKTGNEYVQLIIGSTEKIKVEAPIDK
jgi:hypothetical protein